MKERTLTRNAKSIIILAVLIMVSFLVFFTTQKTEPDTSQSLQETNQDTQIDDATSSQATLTHQETDTEEADESPEPMPIAPPIAVKTTPQPVVVSGNATAKTELGDFNVTSTTYTKQSGYHNHLDIYLTVSNTSDNTQKYSREQFTLTAYYSDGDERYFEWLNWDALEDDCDGFRFLCNEDDQTTITLEPNETRNVILRSFGQGGDIDYGLRMVEPDSATLKWQGGINQIEAVFELTMPEWIKR